MTFRDSDRAGHLPTLICALLYLQVSSMAWALPSLLGERLGESLHLTPAQNALLVDLPILSAIACSLVFGILADRIGARRTALIGLSITGGALLFAWAMGGAFMPVLIAAVLLGGAGGSFAVALPLVSRWYSEEQQGLVLGVVGVGQGGAALMALIFPRLLAHLGLPGVFGAAFAAVAVVFVLFALLAREAPELPEAARRIAERSPLKSRDAYVYAGYYAITFGILVGVLAFLPGFFRIQYGVAPGRAWVFAALFALAGSLLRPVGGYLADRLGGGILLFLSFLAAGLLGLRLSYLPHLEIATLCVFLMVALLSMGSGAVFQLVPAHFCRTLGSASGMISGAGVLSGFLVPLALAGSRHFSGRFGPGFFVIGMAGLFTAGLLAQASRDWHIHWLPAQPPRTQPATRSVP